MLDSRITCGHPGRKYCGKGMCRSCYSAQWFRDHPEAHVVARSKSRAKEKARGALLSPEQIEERRRKCREQMRRWRSIPENKAKANARSKEACRLAYHDPDGARKQQVRESRFKNKYGITTADYDAMCASQGGLCFICRKPEIVSQGYGLKRLTVDHDHKTGRIRGLLCQHCNQLLGHSYEDIAILKAAIDYLYR